VQYEGNGYPLSSAATQSWFSCLAHFGQGEKGLSPALLILTMEQPFFSINALQLPLFDLLNPASSSYLGISFQLKP
jgi:hypothetical protein